MTTSDIAGITPAAEQASEATTKCYSLDDETFNHNSLGDLLDDMAGDEWGLQVGRVYYEADSQELTPDYMADAGAVFSLLEQLDEDLFDEVGETADNDFIEASPEAREELRVLLRGWIERHVNIIFKMLTCLTYKVSHLCLCLPLSVGYLGG